MTDRERLIDRISALTEEETIKLLDMVFTEFGPGEAEAANCPHCGGECVIRYGRKCGKQRFLCKGCGRTFVTTTHTIMYHSHFSKSIWKRVIADTIRGYAIDFTAKELGVYHQAMFDMRHKVLTALQALPEISDIQLGGVVEVDETFVLDSYKGKPLEENVDRNPRTNGGIAQKPGISSEYICINTAIERDGNKGSYAITVNRAKPDIQEIQSVYGGHISDGALILCDGLRSYNVLPAIAKCSICDCNSKPQEESPLFNLNTVNNFHSFLKHRYEFYRGVATKYLNRYNALFAAAFRNCESVIVHLKDLLLSVSSTDYYHSIRYLKTTGLVTL